jgi:hypothetical protein
MSRGNVHGASFKKITKISGKNWRSMIFVEGIARKRK